MVFTPRPATELTVAQTFNALTDQLLLVRSGQVFKLAELPVGPQGDDGADGADGSPGPSVELRTSGGFLQYQVAGSDNWINLVALSDISGSSISAAPGVPDDQEGREGDLYIDTNDGELYFRGPTNWFTIGNITGPQGATGPQGEQGPSGSGGGVVLYPYENTPYNYSTEGPLTGLYFSTNGSVTIDNLSDTDSFDFSVFLNGGFLVFNYDVANYPDNAIQIYQGGSLIQENNPFVPGSGVDLSFSGFGLVRFEKVNGGILVVYLSNGVDSMNFF